MADDRKSVFLWTRNRDPQAFTDLVSRHGPALARLAAAVLGSAGRKDPCLIEDALQEGLGRLMDALPSYRGEADPFVFMASVVRRACLDTLRRERRARGRLDRATALDALGQQAEREREDPSEEAERALLADRVMEALDGLDEPERSLVYLRDAEGVSVAELSKAFGIPEGTVKSKLSRARTRLRARLAKEGVDV